jgi:RimJ/RimL family protein N-acetyltransferase
MDAKDYPAFVPPERAPQLPDSEPIAWFDLTDRLRVGLRPIHPDDREQLLEGFAALSEESRYHRFLTPVPRLTARQAAYLTELDQVNHFAWGAGIPKGHELRGIGVARYVRATGDPASAELAVAVTDDYQGVGLGSLLVTAITVVATSHRIERITGYMHAENRPMIKIFERLDARFDRESPGVVFAEATLASETPPQIPEAACTELIRIADRAAHPSALQRDRPEEGSPSETP